MEVIAGKQLRRPAADLLLKLGYVGLWEMPADRGFWLLAFGPDFTEAEAMLHFL